MKRHPLLALRLLGAAALLPALPAGAATAAPDQLAQASQVAQQAAPQAPQAAQGSRAAPLTVPVQQPASADPGAPDEGRRRGDNRRAFVEAGIAALHAGLLLTPAQQSLWPPVEAALRDFAATRGGMRHHRGDERDGDRMADPLARLRARGARLVARGQAMGKLADAAGPLLAALSPEQKDRVPRLLRGIMSGRMMAAHGPRGERFGMGGPGMDGPRMDGPGMDGPDMDGRGFRHHGGGRADEEEDERR